MYQAHTTTTYRQSDNRPLHTIDNEIFGGDVSFSTRTTIETIEDIVKARQVGRLLAQELGFSSSRSTLVTTVISELARNIVLYAGQGEVVLSRLNKGAQVGILVEAIDNGPGIEDIERALKGGLSSSGGLGLGLTGVKQLADDFEVTSIPGEGTTVSINIWRHG